MKKQFAKLSKAERAEIESAYHNENPQDFDDLMSRAKLHRPGAKSRPKSPGNATAKTKTPLKQVSK
jgi:hypothetical protein